MIGRKSTHDSCALLFPSAPKNQKIFRAEIIDDDYTTTYGKYFEKRRPCLMTQMKQLVYDVLDFR